MKPSLEFGGGDWGLGKAVGVGVGVSWMLFLVLGGFNMSVRCLKVICDTWPLKQCMNNHVSV